jgi:hypothetical protein
VKKLIVAVVMCLMAASTDAAFGQSGRVGWDGTWVGGWEKGTGVQLIFAGETIGFYFRDDYKELLRSTVAAGGVEPSPGTTVRPALPGHPKAARCL